MARPLSRFWFWKAPLTVGILAAAVFAAGFVLALRGTAGTPLGKAPPPARECIDVTVLSSSGS